MKIVSWNINGIRSIAGKGFAESLEAIGADIVGLQETRADQSQVPLDLLNPRGYRSHWAWAEKKGYSGVGLYTLPHPSAVTTSLGRADFDSEGRVIRAEYPGFTLYNVYFPNGSGSDRSNGRVPYKLDFYGHLLNEIVARKTQGRESIVMGDYNTAHRPIDLKNWKSNQTTSGFLPEEREWIDRYLAAGLVDTFRHLHPEQEGAYSWWSFRGNARANNVGWRIDYVMITDGLLPRLKEAFILPDITGSDHCPVGIVLDG